jgi:hypothetical protein
MKNESFKVASAVNEKSSYLLLKSSILIDQILNLAAEGFKFRFALNSESECTLSVLK